MYVLAKPECVRLSGSALSWPPALLRFAGTAVRAVLILVLYSAFAGPAAAQSPPVFIRGWGSPGSGDGQFNWPMGIAVDANGNVYVSDSGNHRIQKFDSAGTFVTKWGGLGAGIGQFRDPCGIAVDGVGNVYVADVGNSRIQKFDGNGTFLATWGSFGTNPGQFLGPVGVAVDGQGFVFVVDQSTGVARLQKFDGNGGFIGSWQLHSRLGQLHVYDIAAGVGDVLHIVKSSEGIAGVYSPHIEVRNNDGVYLFSWGTHAGWDGTFSNPRGLGTDSEGSVYVVDATMGRIQKFDSQGSFITGWGALGSGDGESGWWNDVAIGPSGAVYATDGQGNRVQEFGEALVPALPTSWGRVKAIYR